MLRPDKTPVAQTKEDIINPIYINIIFKMLVAFCILLVYINLFGKGSLALISAIDQVGNVVLGRLLAALYIIPPSA